MGDAHFKEEFMAHEMLIWTALAKTRDKLSLYIKSAPVEELNCLNALSIHIAEVEKSILYALNNYEVFITQIETWYQQLSLEKVDHKHALALLQDINDVLRALETDCKQLIWPLSTRIPKNLYQDIEKLLTLSLIKQAALLQKQDDEQRQNLINPTTKDLLNHLLNQGIDTLMTKKNMLAENKQANQDLIKQFKCLEQCLQQPEANIMPHFWQNYSSLGTFQALLNLLLLAEEEKQNWLQTHAYFRTDLNQSVNMLTFLNKQFFGINITPDLLKQKLKQSIKSFYLQIIEQQQQHSNESKYLEQIEAAIAGSEIDPTLHQLILLQQSINEPLLDDELSTQQTCFQLQTLTSKIHGNTAIEANEVKKLRYQLHQLRTTIDEIQLSLEFRNQAQLDLYQQIETLDQQTQQTEFNLSELDKTKLLELTQKFRLEVKQHFIELLPETIKTQVTLDNDTAYATFVAFLKEKSLAVEQILLKLNQESQTERELALEELNRFIHKKHDIWEWLLRFFSPTYCQCMASVEAILRNDKCSIEKVDLITEQFYTAKKETGFFVNQRITLFAAHHPQGMFEPIKESVVLKEISLGL